MIKIRTLGTYCLDLNPGPAVFQMHDLRQTFYFSVPQSLSIKFV